MISLNGDINTGILIRTTYLRDGMARYPVGATLLYDSVPEMEERETRHEGDGLLPHAGRGGGDGGSGGGAHEPVRRAGAKLLLVDNDDCFIHTLANYARQTGAEVVTYRAGFPAELMAQVAPNLILISPGPGRPADFGVPDLVKNAVRLGVPVFGVCLGLQGIVEAFGGELGVLDYPMHGKPSTGAAPRRRGVRGPAGGISGGPLPFAVRAPGDISGLPGSDGGDRRRRDHGSAASRVADRSGAVPSGIDSHRRRRPRA